MKTKKLIAQNTKPKIANSFFQAIAAIENVKEAQEFLKDLCTPTELQAMSDRWLVVNALQQGKSYRQISAETGISVTTIGRVARFMSLGNGGYDLIFNRLNGKNYDK